MMEARGFELIARYRTLGGRDITQTLVDKGTLPEKLEHSQEMDYERKLKHESVQDTAHLAQESTSSAAIAAAITAVVGSELAADHKIE